MLRFSGPDAIAFLQGQLTCDVQALGHGSSTYGGYCTPKGRLLATFLLWRHAEGCSMLLPAELAVSIHKRLSMYILRSKVKAEDLSGQWCSIGITSPDDAKQIAISDISLPERTHQVLVHDETTIIRLPAERWLVVAPLAAAAATAQNSTWQALDIAAGIPWISTATQEQFVPQMVNLDRIGALTYTKGCYPGQEIVARTHYLGRLKQRMYRAHVDACAQPGDKLYSDDLGDQASGMILNATARPQGGSTVLAVLRVDNVAQTAHHLGAPGGPALQLDTLPYALE